MSGNGRALKNASQGGKISEVKRLLSESTANVDWQDANEVSDCERM